MPERNTPEYYAMGLIDQILVEGDDSALYQELVQKRGVTAGVEGNQLSGHMFNYKGRCCGWRTCDTTRRRSRKRLCKRSTE